MALSENRDRLIIISPIEIAILWIYHHFQTRPPMCVYIYIHIYKYTYIYIYINIYICTYIHTYASIVHVKLLYFPEKCVQYLFIYCSWDPKALCSIQYPVPCLGNPKTQSIELVLSHEYPPITFIYIPYIHIYIYVYIP